MPIGIFHKYLSGILAGLTFWSGQGSIMFIHTKCKSSNVRGLAWVDMNSRMYQAHHNDEDDPEFYCEKCQKHITHEEIKAYE